MFPSALLAFEGREKGIMLLRAFRSVLDFRSLHCLLEIDSGLFGRLWKIILLNAVSTSLGGFGDSRNVISGDFGSKSKSSIIVRILTNAQLMC